MKKFFKSFLLLVTAGLFTATGWAAGESISIGFNHTRTNDDSKFTGETLYGWTDAQVAGNNWNHIESGNNNPLNNVTLGNLKLNTGVVLNNNVELSNNSFASTSIESITTAGSWRHYGPTALGGGTRDYYDGQISFTLKNIPFTQYKVVLFMATNDGNKTWGAVKVTSNAEDEGKYYTYVDGVLSAEGTAESTWGNSSSLTENYTATEGTNVMVIPNLSGDKTFLTYGTSGTAAATRGGLYAIQIINTGLLKLTPAVLTETTSYWSLQNSKADQKNVVSWAWNYTDTDVYVDSLRKDEAGVAYKAAKITEAFHPGAGYDWPNEFTVAAYANVEKCLNEGAIVSVGSVTTLRKLNATTMRFGGTNVYVDADMPYLSQGYHLFIVKKSDSGLSIQIDDGDAITVNNTSTINNGLQIGVKWTGGNASYNNDGGPIVDDVAIWNKALSDTEIEQLLAYYPVCYPVLSMEAADTDSSGALSWSEITAVVGTRTTWDISGEVKISLDADVDPALTALTLLPANASGDSLTIEGTGSLWAKDAAFALTTGIPVDVTNNKNNPRITLSGTGNVTIRKPTTGGGGIVPTFNNYSGTLTVDDGQQITRMDDELSIPFTVGEGGAKLHANDGRWHVASKISGSGPLVVVGPSGSGTEDRIVVFSNNETDHTGPVTIESGRVRLGSNSGWDNPGADTAFGDQTTITVKEGAMCRLHYGYTNQTNASFVFEGNTTFGNVDGNAILNGSITIRGSAEKPVAFPFHWDKTLTVNGKLSGEGTLVLANPSKGNWGGWTLTNNANDFTGTIKLGGNRTRLTLNEGAFATGHVEFGAAGELVLNADNTIAGLTGASGTVKSNDSNERNLTLNGDSDVRNLTFTNVNLVIAAGETYIISTTKATVESGAKVKVVLTVDQKLSGLTLGNVTVNDGGTVVFLDADGTTVLQSANSNAYAGAQECTYTVAEEDGAWNKEPKDNDAITLAFGEITGRTLEATILPEGVTRLAKITITGSNASISAELAACADMIESATTWSLVGGAEESVEVSSVISGAGQVKIASGKVTFSGANTYTGGTDIVEGATLTISHANALSTSGTITGAGTLVCNAVRPANMTGLTTGTAASGETPASGWTGTVWLKNVTANASIKEFANANASLTLEGSKGHFTSFSVKTLTLMGKTFGFQPSDGSSGPSTAHNVMTIGALKGNGSLLGPTKNGSNGAYCYAYVIGDMSEFTGTLDTTSYGDRTVVWCGVTEQSMNYHDYNGKIIIAVDTAIAATKTWSAVNGIAIMDGTTLTVNGAITGTIANAGVLTYKVDTTASNTFTGAGFIIADGEGVELDLSAATLTDFGGAFNAINGATIKLPYAATAGKMLSCDETSTFVVVYSDAETEQNNLRAVTVTGTGTLQFVDEAGNALPSSGSTYVLPTYTVTDEGGSWNVTPLQNNKVVIDFGATAGSVNLTDEILGSVTTLSKLVIKGTNGGTITNSAVTACPIVEVLATGRTEVPAALTNLATTVTGPTAEGSLLYVTGETTTDQQAFPYTGNRHFEMIKFEGRQNIGDGIDNYVVAEGETIEFLYDNGVRYVKGLVVDGGTIRTTYDKHVWLAGEANSTFTLKAGLADFSVVTVDSGSDGLLIGYNGSTHTFDIQGGTLDASNTSIVGYQPSSQYRQSGGTVKTKGFRQNGSNFTEMTLTGGTIELGSGGLPNLGMASASIEATTIHAVANNTVAEALNMTGNATLSAAENTTMTVTSTFTGTATLSIAGAGTVDLSGATIPNTIALNVAAGATAVVAADQISTFAKVTIPETATLKVKLTVDCLISGRLNCTLGAESTLDGTIVLDGIEGETTTFTDGVLSVTFTANPTLTGNAWWWDYEFDGNVNSTGSDTAPLVLEGNGTSYVTVDGDNQALYFQKTPYRNNGEDVKARFAEVDTFTAVMYCQPGNHNNVPLVGFGSTTQNDKVAVVLATGAVAADGEMAIMLVKGDNHVVTPLADNLVVPNATKAYHLYAFTFDAQADKTVISVYVDGKLKKTTTVNEHFRVSNGFQIGSIHGGVMTNQTGLSKYPDSGDSGTIDFLRVTKGLLSADAMRALAEAYPYHSENGTATRTVADATANWVADDTWSQAIPNAEAVQQAAPNNGTNVTLTANVATEVTVNLTEAVTYETVTVVGDAAVTFKKGEAATFKAGDITIGTDVTIEYGAINVGTLIVNGGKTLIFDFTRYDFNSIYASKTLPLTGLTTLGENATVTVALPKLPAYLTAECVFDADNSEYALAITVTGTLAATIENNAITWKVGETVVTPPADLTAVGSITMTVVGDNSVTLPEMTLASVVLTGEGNAVTFESGKLTVNNTLTMNNVNVMATPETLIAAVVTGTAGTETFTMHSQASYSHENKFAMRFENCALTKAGAGTFPIASSGFVLDRVNVTLANGALQLVIGSGDPQIKDTTFTYVDANADSVADGELTNHGWVHSTTTTTFIVPEGVTGKALVGSCLTDTGAVVKQGAGTLELGVMKTDNAGPYTGATTINAGTLVYDVTNITAETFVMQSAITVKAGAAIKGVEDCTLASLTFEAGAIVDATDAPVTATDVTLPETGTVTVRMASHGEVLLTSDLVEADAEKFALETPVANWSLVVTENGLVYVAAPDTGDVEFSAEVQEMLNTLAQAAAAYEGITSLTIEGITLSANGENVVKADIAGLELFENVPVLVVPDGENGTGVAMVNYVFGINSITVNAEKKIVVTASVDCLGMENFVEPIEGEDAGEGEGEMPELPRPTFVNGVTVVLYNGNVVLGTETITESTSEVTIESEYTYDTIFNPPAAAQDEGESATPSAPSSQTLQLTIKATTTPPAVDTPAGEEVSTL